ncbi:hypothetical protein GE061_012436, partial [Apolygus lucorum]
MIGALQRRYSGEGQEHLYMSLLRNRRQRPKEDLASFASEVELLARRALPGALQVTVDALALPQFFHGIAHDRLREQVLACPATTVQEALGYAQRLEANLLCAARARIPLRQVGYEDCPSEGEEEDLIRRTKTGQEEEDIRKRGK